MISSEKSGRGCDNCVKKRARWYCGADDAFLCQICDSSVHSANPLARRHQRVRLKCHDDDEPHSDINRASSSSWHRRKPRTPRKRKSAGISHPLRVVPELEISGEEENENEQLLYRVPEFDPYVCSSGSNEGLNHGFDLPSEMDLAEFESLLGNDDEYSSFDMGILDYCDHENNNSNSYVKVEEEHDQFIGLNFDYAYSPIMGHHELEDADKEKTVAKMELEDSDKVSNYNKILLRLDYQGVMSAWDDHKSPWMTGKRPDVDSDHCWPHCMGTCGTLHAHGEMGMMSGHGAAAAMVDGGREARVSRYREKRRRRLFSKKIRYEVRKLNAEKRPRMKGRFVKKANLVAPA